MRTYVRMCIHTYIHGTYHSQCACVSNGSRELHHSYYYIQGFAESLQHCIRPQLSNFLIWKFLSSVTSLYESVSALNLPYIRKLLSSEVSSTVLQRF